LNFLIRPGGSGENRKENMKKAKGGKIKNLAKPKSKRTSGARVSNSQKAGLRKQTQRIANKIGEAEKGQRGGFGIGI
jgi:hypothetical protein